MQIIGGDAVISQFGPELIAIRSACVNCVRSRRWRDSSPSELYGINSGRAEKKHKKNQTKTKPVLS